MLYDSHGNKIEKEIVYDSDLSAGTKTTRGKRGISVYYPYSLNSQTGKNKDGESQTIPVDFPFYFLSLSQRIQIFRLSSPIFGVVTSRMNKMAGLDFNVIPKVKTEDKDSENLKQKKSIFDEFKNTNELRYVIVKNKMYNELIQDLPELLPDMSNFNSALLRWKKRIRENNTDRCNEIKDWLLNPNRGLSWQEWVKQYVFDLMVHGSEATYKNIVEGRLENFSQVAGGTVLRMKSPYFSAVDAYVQVVGGFEPQVFYENEISYSEYIPCSGIGYGLVPLEALINKVAESLLFDELMAEQADGTKPPNKAVLLSEGNNPYGTLNQEADYTIPIDSNEQKRIEEKLKDPIKHGIISFSGHNAEILDLTRENTMDVQRERQKDIREEVGLVYNATNIEMNLGGSEFTSGRSTSEAQLDIAYGRGIAPLVEMLENKLIKDLIPFRFGYGYNAEFVKGENQMEQRQLDSIRLQNGEVTKNELREEYDRPPFDKEEYNYPDGVPEGDPGNSEMAPMFTKQVQ